MSPLHFADLHCDTVTVCLDRGKRLRQNDLLAHVRHFLALGGEDVLALGSDFDGAEIPPYLDSLEKIENLRQALLASGIDDRITNKILLGNAMNFYRKNL